MDLDSGDASTVFRSSGRRRNALIGRRGRRCVTDLQETPATPPEPTGGDERIGYLVAGGVLLALGWGLGVALNLALHWMARSGAFTFWGVHFEGTMGAYAWAVFGLGLVSGALGLALMVLAGATPRGKFVLPGVEY